MNTVAIVQARLGSTRLPRKVLMDIAGTLMLSRIVQRTAAATAVDSVVVATTTAPEDDELVAFVRRDALCSVFRGPVDDVLARFHGCAVESRADVIVRVTADDPLKDPGIIDRAVALLLEAPDRDYCSNTIEPSYPEGLDIEVFRFRALDRAHREARLPSEREHVTPYIWKHPEWFNVLNFKSDRDDSDWRWTVDRPADIEFMRRVFEHFRDRPLVSYHEVRAWLEAHPEVRRLNAGIQRNEGYQKSLSLEQT